MTLYKNLQCATKNDPLYLAPTHVLNDGNLFFPKHQSFINNDTKGMRCFKLFNGIFTIMTKVQCDNIQI
jgi:hypothetical protein